MISKDDLHAFMQKEFETTRKVMRAYPADKMMYAPHERSNTAAQLFRTFIFELHLMEYALGTELNREIFKTYQVDDRDSIIADFEKMTSDILLRVNEMSDGDLVKELPFADKTFLARDLLNMFVHDQIHHRGQLTVYIRLNGGQVPSVYGPSADDKSTNL